MQYYHELTQQSKLIAELRHQFEHLIPKPYSVINYVEPEDETPLMKQYLAHAGLHSERSRFFYSGTRFRTQVHKDADGRLCALNIPITVPKISGMMRWWDKPEWKSVCHFQDNHVYLRMAYNEEGLVSTPEEIKAAAVKSKQFTKDVPPTVEVKLTKPTIVRVDEWHDINNEGSDVWRIIYSMRFAENPSFDELVSRFKDIPELGDLT